jgi:hypothetical protein
LTKIANQLHLDDVLHWVRQHASLERRTVLLGEAEMKTSMVVKQKSLFQTKAIPKTPQKIKFQDDNYKNWLPYKNLLWCQLTFN